MEEIVDQVVDGADVAAGRIPKPSMGHLAVVSALALGAGAGIAWYVTKRHYQSKFEQIIEEEREEIKAFYARLYKKDEFATPGDAVETLGVPGTAATALTSYGAHKLEELGVEVTETVEVEVAAIEEAPEDDEPTTRNVFDGSPTDEVWDQDKEEAYRASLEPGIPYIISQMEYNENENDYEQRTLTYYADDDVLVDEHDKPIELIDEVVGEDNVTRFGHGIMDGRIVLVRNDRLNMDFEVIRHDGSYSKDVLGFQHSDGPRIRKFRGVDE